MVHRMLLVCWVLGSVLGHVKSCTVSEMTSVFYLMADSNSNGSLDVEELFAMMGPFDKDVDGDLTSEELVPAWMTWAGLTPEKGKEYFSKIDVDNDNVLSQEDVLELIMKNDTDGDSEISDEEFDEAMTNIGIPMSIH